MQQYHVDVLHTHNTYADVVGLLAARLAPARTITTLYVWAKFHWRRNMLQTINGWLLPHFDLVSAHCEETYRRTLASGVREDKLRLLICGYEAARVDYTAEERRCRRREMGIHDGEIVLANIARLYPEKAQDQLLRAFPALLQRYPKARLWIAGIGPLERELKSLCSSLGLDSAVRFLGFVQDLPALLGLVDIQVSTSTAEGVPLAICAGMAAGLPIVATDVGGISEILDHGRAGHLVPPGVEADFLNAVTELIENPQKRIYLGRAARRFIENDYSLETAVRRLEHVYLEVLGECA
jgi:glycosyltransferase involved in cell wall biosynthesis